MLLQVTPCYVAHGRGNSVACIQWWREDESTRLFSVVAHRYVREVFPTKSDQTRRDKELANLLRVFGHMPIDAIAPMY